jgi:hypothetical protein
MGSVIPPEYGVPLSADELMSTIPTSILYGVTPSNEFIPIKITSDGTVDTNATFTGTITIGEIGNPDESAFVYGTTKEQTIGGVYQDTNPTLSSGTQGAVRLTEYRAFHTNLRDSNGIEIDPATESTAVSILADLDKFTFSSNRLIVDGSQVTQPISAVTLPLPTNAAQETGGNLASINAGIETLNSLVPSVYDYIALSYTSGNLTTAVYKHGGSGGTVVSTLTIAYDVSNNITSVTKS